MAFEEIATWSRISLPASADLSAKQYFAMSIDTSNGEAQVCSATDAMLGILQNNPIENDTATIQTSGISKAAISASQSLNAGSLLEVDTAGTLKLHSAGVVVAASMEALTSTASIAIVAARLLPANIGT